jgi:integrase
VEVRAGTHVADSASCSVKDAGELWVIAGEQSGLERSTLAQRRQHLDLHINPMIGGVLLSKLNPPTVRAFEDRLLTDGRNRAMLRRVMTSMSSILADAQERGLVARNIVRDLRSGRKRGKDRQAEKRQNGKIRIGVDIPTNAEIKAIIETVQGRWRPLLLTAIFTGLRASELRGLPWRDIDLAKRELLVTQRADRYNRIGKPKSHSGERTVPLPPLVVNTLREWKIKCPKGELGLAFPNGKGNIESLINIRRRGQIRTLIKAGVTAETDEIDEDTGGPVVTAKYTGLHAFRHWFASWCINRKEDGGLSLSAKMVQERMGHSNIATTLDVYGHLFPRGDDENELANAERALLA